YFAEEGALQYGFSPDGAADLSYGEKGISQLDLYFDATNPENTTIQLINFKSGSATNVLPGFAEATFSGISTNSLQENFEQYCQTENITGELKQKDNQTTLTVQGVATHAARPRSEERRVGKECTTR